MLDVLVTCFPHAPELSYFPQVRGYYLARHLRRAGLAADFRHLGEPGEQGKVVICSEYQSPADWFDRNLAGPLAELEAERYFCMTDYSLGDLDHRCRASWLWFAERGGVLYHLPDREPKRFEHEIGVGVDSRAVRAVRGRRDTIAFDFRRSRLEDAADVFDPARLEAAREVFGGRIVGTGPADSPLVGLFDAWIPYGRPHDRYVRELHDRLLAFVVGLRESLGLAVAEAQMAGAAVLFAPGDLRPGIICEEAAITYDPDDVASFAAAIEEAGRRDPVAIRRQACERFDYARVVRRTREAVGV